MKKGIDINFGNPSPLQCAVEKNFEDIIENLITLGVDVNLGNPTPLQSAVNHNLENVVNILITANAAVNLGIPSPLYYAIKNNNEKITNLLIKKGTDVNQCNPSALLEAIQQNNPAIAMLLIDAGIEINKISKRKIKISIKEVTQPSHRSKRGHYYPAITGDREIVIKQLTTPLYLAIENNNIELSKILLLSDADPTLKTSYKRHCLLPSIYKENSSLDILKNDDENHQKIKSMIYCLDKIYLMKKAFKENLKSIDIISQLCKAYNENVIFLLDYITNKIREINLNLDKINMDDNYILKFIELFCFMAKNPYSVPDNDAYAHFQNTLLAELNGHDPENIDQKIKFFDNYKEKNEYIKKYVTGASWEASYLLMSGNNKNNIIDNQYKDEPNPKKRRIEFFEQADTNNEKKKKIFVILCNAAKKDDENNSLQQLLNQKIDINTKNPDDGSTVLHFAVGQGIFDAVQFLLSNGANSALKDNDDETALDWVNAQLKDASNDEIENFTKIKELLEGANSDQKIQSVSDI